MIGYMGSGSLIRKAIKKYGIQNFKKEILFYCNSLQQMILKEKEIVNQEFLQRNDVYNLTLGGNVGWTLLQGHYSSKDFSNWGRIGANKLKERLESDQKFKQWYIKKLTNVMNSQERKEKFHKSITQYYKTHKGTFTGKHHSKQTIQKIKLAKQQNLPIGQKNGAYGSCWIYNLQLKQNKRIKKEQLQDYLNNGWIKGRITDFQKFNERQKLLIRKKFSREQKQLLKQHKIEQLNQLILEKEKQKQQKYKNSIQLAKLYFQEYKINGFAGVKEKYNYQYTSQNLLGFFKLYIKNDFYNWKNNKKFYSSNLQKPN